MRSVLPIAAALAFFLPSNAWATNWARVAGTNGGDITSYVDRASIRRIGSIVRVWTRSDYVNNKDGWVQDITFEEHDCANGRKRNLQISVYFATGGNESTSMPGAWRYVVPESLMESVHLSVCGS
jgi:hypothetical protein